ncbi:helix-turn-helix domain-containing protein [Streptomyces luteogriseus]|uniref:helix-turn-helix domain-containing protein n=1 Tax=Streptomyces luteogriseus TaxID=68233 RepID=UPI003806E156
MSLSHGEDERKGARLGRAIGARLRRLRTERNLSQAELAGPELSASYISLIEADKRLPSPRALKLIAARLNCAPDEIYDAAAAEADASIDFALAEAEWSLVGEEFDSALERFREIRRLAARAALHEQALRAAWGEARALERLDRFEAAIDVYSDLLQDAHLAHDEPLTRWAIISSLCRCEIGLGEAGRAVDRGEKALDELRDLGAAPSAAAIEIMCELVRAYLHRGDVMRARRLTAEAIAEAEVLQDPQQLARAYRAAGQAARDAGRTTEAVGLTRRAVDLLVRGSDEAVLGEALALHGMALLWADERYVQEAERDLRRAAEIHERGRRFAEAARCYLELARCALVGGDASAAMKSAERALTLLATAPAADRAQALTLTAAALAMGGRNSEAILRCDEAVAALSQDDRDLRRQALIWGETAEVYVALGQTAKGVDAWRRGFTLLQAIGPLPLHPPFSPDEPVVTD